MATIHVHYSSFLLLTLIGVNMHGAAPAKQSYAAVVGRTEGIIVPPKNHSRARGRTDSPAPAAIAPDPLSAAARSLPSQLSDSLVIVPANPAKKTTSKPRNRLRDWEKIKPEEAAHHGAGIPNQPSGVVASILNMFWWKQ